MLLRREDVAELGIFALREMNLWTLLAEAARISGECLKGIVQQNLPVPGRHERLLGRFLSPSEIESCRKVLLYRERNFATVNVPAAATTSPTFGVLEADSQINDAFADHISNFSPNRKYSGDVRPGGRPAEDHCPDRGTCRQVQTHRATDAYL